MELNRDSKLLRIFIGEMDKLHSTPLCEALVFAAKKQGQLHYGVFSPSEQAVAYMLLSWKYYLLTYLLSLKLWTMKTRLHSFLKRQTP